MKKCNTCNLIQEPSNYYKNSRTKDQLSNKCIKCISIDNKVKYRIKNPKVIIKNKKKCNSCNKIKSNSSFYKKKSYFSSHCKECSKLNYRKFQIQRDYNITYDDYLLMIKKQDNKCIICNQNNKRALCIDHCHKTNKVRGLLCDNCNTGLGKFKDDINLLNKAIEYLEKY